MDNMGKEASNSILSIVGSLARLPTMIVFIPFCQYNDTDTTLNLLAHFACGTALSAITALGSRYIGATLAGAFARGSLSSFAWGFDFCGHIRLYRVAT